MTWAKIDDGFHAHPKARKAWRAHPRALGMHLLALSYCAMQLLDDGVVDEAFVEEKIPQDRERRAVIDALVDAGLWDRVDGGWLIHDWLEYNPSRAEVEARRRERSESGKRGADKRWHGNSHSTTDGNSHGGSDSGRHDHVHAPVPTPTPLTTSDGSRSMERPAGARPRTLRGLGVVS